MKLLFGLLLIVVGVALVLIGVMDIAALRDSALYAYAVTFNVGAFVVPGLCACGLGGFLLNRFAKSAPSTFDTPDVPSSAGR